MAEKVEPRLAIVETSQRLGWVALALGEKILASRRLDDARRHARDLAPFLAELLAEQGWQAGTLDGVIVSRGPGSYTGLRVGIMSAKTLAYASGCALLAIDTFAAVALQTPTAFSQVHVLADAQQDKVYTQRFVRQPSSWQADGELKIMALDAWKATLLAEDGITGPALETFAGRLPPEARVVAAEHWLPRPESLLRLGLDQFQLGQKTDPFSLEPLYLRPSSAEEKQGRI